MKEDLSLQLALGPCQKHWSWVVNVQVWETGASAFWKFIESFFGTVHFTDAPKNHRRSSFKFSSQSLETARNNTVWKKTVLGHKKPLARATADSNAVLHLSWNRGDRVGQTRHKTRFDLGSNDVLDHYLKVLGHITNTYIDDNQWCWTSSDNSPVQSPLLWQGWPITTPPTEHHTSS